MQFNLPQGSESKAAPKHALCIVCLQSAHLYTCFVIRLHKIINIKLMPIVFRKIAYECGYIPNENFAKMAIRRLC